MCLLLLAVDAHPRHRLVVAANRDEYHRRPTAPVDLWPGRPDLLAGRDLEAGGTWLGVTRGGRFAALTNFREPGRHRADAPSRGGLVAAFLTGSAAPAEYLVGLVEGAGAYNGFSLVVGDGQGLHYLSNRGPGPLRLSAGVHGLSNHLLDTPWPKVARGRARLAALLERPEVEPAALLELLADREPPPDRELPDTGVGLELERLLAPACVVSAAYGTRCSTALLVGRDGEVRCVERTLAADGTAVATRDLGFRIAAEGGS
jgi:uncharacterized protein with NRDE domain